MTTFVIAEHPVKPGAHFFVVNVDGEMFGTLTAIGQFRTLNDEEDDGDGIRLVSRENIFTRKFTVESSDGNGVLNVIEIRYERRRS